MALFSLNPNLAPDIPKPRMFQGGFGAKAKLAISGVKPSGEANLFGDFVSDVLPPVLGAISAYYTGSYTLGDSVGNLIAKGQDKAAENMLGGTSGAEVNQQQQAKDDRTRGLISTIGNTAASVYSAAGGSTYKSNSSSVGSTGENRILDDALSGVSTQGLQDYVADNGSFNLSKTLNAVGNLGEIKNNLQSTSSFDPSRVDPNSALNKFFGQGNQDFNLGSGLSNYSQSSGMSGLSAAGQQSSIVGGLQGGIKLLDDKKKKSPLDSFFGYDSLNGFNGYQSNSLEGYSSLNGFAEGGVTTSDDYKIYDKNDTTTEDLFIIDKSVAEQHGVSDLLSGIAMGQMRYGETVFDQHSTLIQENIMNSNASEEDKISMLGSHVYQELQDQPNREFAGFAKGGKTKPKQAAQPVSNYLQPANMSGDFTEAKNLYNSWAQSKGLPTLSSSNFDENAAVAFTNYNADRTNQRKLQVETTPYLDSASNSTRSMVSRIGLSQFMPELNVQPLDRIVGYNKGGQAVFSDQVVSTTKLPSSDKLLVANNDYFPVAGDNTTTKIPALSKTTTNGDKELRADAFKKESLINNISSLAQMGLGGLLATTPQPTYSPPAEYSAIRDEIYNNRNQGLSAAENANISQGLQQSYANGVNTVRNIGGGGATQGSILATLGGLSNSLDQGVLNQGLLNANAQRSNLQAAQQASLTDLNLDRSLFAQQQANALETKNNGLALLAQGSQNLYDQGLFNQSYGPDSLYNQLQESQLAGAQRYNDLANIQSQLALDNLAKQGGLGANALTPNTAPIYQLPNVTTPRF